MWLTFVFKRGSILQVFVSDFFEVLVVKLALDDEGQVWFELPAFKRMNSVIVTSLWKLILSSLAFTEAHFQLMRSC